MFCKSKYHFSILSLIIFFSLVGCQFQDPYKNHGITFLDNRSNKLVVKKSNFNDLPRFVMIDNAELLNKNSVNALLKIIEEPNVNVCFILIQNSNYKMLDTLRSRCYLFKVRISYKDTIKIVNNFFDRFFV